MASYISSNENRFYVANETQYGQVAAITGANRISAVALTARQQLERVERRDKMGGRTFAGLPTGLRKVTDYELRTYMIGWTDQNQEPSCGPLFRAALGGQGLIFGGGTVESLTNQTRLRLNAPHGLAAGQAIAFGGEIRFADTIVDPQTVQLNAPFSISISGGSPIGKTCTYRPSGDLSSVCVFDYWSPESSVHRIVRGAAVDRMRVDINGDFHEFQFSGPASDIIDSVSFNSGEGNLTQFPIEPSVAGLNYSIVPGHLGQAWLGVPQTQFLTMTSGRLTLENGVDLRAREFGCTGPLGVMAGVRRVTVNLSLFERDDAATAGLYQAARQRTPIGVMFQLGQLSGQVVGIYLKSVVPEVPEFVDSESRLQWSFSGCRAQGTIDDELYVAFA
jgi:hypothetical protein